MDSGDQELVQVPTPLLTSIVASVDALQKSNAALAAEVEMLKNASGRFHRFPKLPAEIRNMIWTFALLAPQIHIMTQSIVSYSRVNTILDVCHEARSQGMKLNLPYFRFGASGTRSYINLNVDTVWHVEGQYFPDNLQVFCPDCPSELNPIFPRYTRLDAARLCPHNLHLKRLVLNWDDWIDPDEGKRHSGDDVDGSVYLLTTLNGGPEELFIVVSSQDDIAIAARDRGVTFVKPQLHPNRQLWKGPQFKDLEDKDLGIFANELIFSWKKMSERLEKILKHHKMNRTEARRIELEVNGTPKEELERWTDFDALDGFRVPKVHYVEVVSNTLKGRWFRPSKLQY